MNYPLNKVIEINKTQTVNGVEIYTRGRFIRKWCIVSPEKFIVAHFNDEKTCRASVKKYTNHMAMIKTIGL